MGLSISEIGHWPCTQEKARLSRDTSIADPVFTVSRGLQDTPKNPTKPDTNSRRWNGSFLQLRLGVTAFCQHPTTQSLTSRASLLSLRHPEPQIGSQVSPKAANVEFETLSPKPTIKEGKLRTQSRRQTWPCLAWVSDARATCDCFGVISLSWETIIM